MGWEAWFTVVVTLVMVVAMARNVAGPDFVLLGGLTLLVTTGVVPLDRDDRVLQRGHAHRGRALRGRRRRA